MAPDILNNRVTIILADKAEAKLYLTDQYTNRSGQMVCQAC